ncbi:MULTISPECIES: GyrI-like domain-containing protein [Paenibacillus]|uniref:GyrI-like domain-containing protein n=1 Tax=Paenibacillus TaxID=44249 RepID=UPI002FE27EF4
MNHDQEFKLEKEIQVAGISVRTTNAEEGGPEGRLPGLWDRYFREGVEQPDTLQNPHLLYAVYTDYESDASGAYTVILGHELQESAEGGGALYSVERQHENGYRKAAISASGYKVFETRRGPVYQVVAEAWGQIWAYFQNSSEQRAYTADYELYDLRNFDPENAVVSIYIALKS